MKLPEIQTIIRVPRLRIIKSVALAIVVLLLAFNIVMAQPELPQLGHYFYGFVTSEGAPAPEGTYVIARVTGPTYTLGPYETTVDDLGRYGYGTGFSVPGDDPDTPMREGASNGARIDFYLKGADLDNEVWAAFFIFQIGGTTQLPLTADIIPPHVVATQPIDAAVDVAQDAIVNATMHEDVTLEDADLVTIVGSVSGNLANGPATLGADNRTLTIPHNDFSALGEHVVVTIGAGAVKDLFLNTNLLFTWAFDTIDITPPYVLSTQPLNGAVNVARNASVTATMNEDVTLENAALVTIVGSVSGNLANGPATLGADIRTLTIPHNDFSALGEHVVVTIGAGAVEDLSLYPNLLFTWAFDTIDITPPYVLSTQPLNGAVNVARNASVTATMNEDVTLENAALVTIVGSVSGNLANGPATLGADHRTLTIPHNDFSPLGEHVVVTIGAGAVEDLAHNPSVLYTWYFDSILVTHQLFLPIVTRN